MTMTKEEMLCAIIEHDSIEVYVDDLPTAQLLLHEGLIELGPSRGPGRNWRRATLAPPPVLSHDAQALIREALKECDGVGPPEQRIRAIRDKLQKVFAPPRG